MFKTKKISIPPSEYLTRKFKIGEGYNRFNQKNDIFNRSEWDSEVDSKNFFVSYDITNYLPKRSKGFNHWDFALRNASWHLTDVVGERDFEETGTVEGFTDFYTIQTQGPADKIELESKNDTTHRIKKAAKMFGAGDVGVCELDDRWLYSHTFNRKTREASELKFPNGL